MKDKIIRLTNTVYKVSEFFPESDPLKNRVKEKALSIMDNLGSVKEDIDILLGYLKIAKMQGWMSNLNYLIISYQYEKLKRDMSQANELILKLPKIEEYLKDEKVDVGLNERQIKILEFLKQKEKAQVMDLQTVLTNITKRTIRRDLDELLKEGKIVRSGEFNQIFYKINQ